MKFRNMNISQLALILFYAFVIIAAIQLLFYWIVFSRLAWYKKKVSNIPAEPVSIVICAKNEYYNLKDYLPLILTQEYPNFEVVVVNDCSDDDSHYLLKDFADEYPHLKIVNLYKNVNFFSGKKFPLSIGIKSAKNDILLLTDADCKPTSNQWLKNMQQHFTGKHDIVLGYGPFETAPGFLNQLIRFDTIHVAMQYLSLALAGSPYMGVGRNLAYRKSLFYKHKGFIDHYTTHSGDDDLFINQAATGVNTTIEIAEESHLLSKPKASFQSWMLQKKRHLTTGTLYKNKHKYILGIYSASQLFFWLLFPVALLFNLFHQDLLLITLSAFAVRQISWMILFKLSMNKLKEKNLLLISPLLELIMIVLIPFIAFTNLFSKEIKWK